jgi:hypothetical protein
MFSIFRDLTNIRSLTPWETLTQFINGKIISQEIRLRLLRGQDAKVVDYLLISSIICKRGFIIFNNALLRRGLFGQAHRHTNWNKQRSIERGKDENRSIRLGIIHLNYPLIDQLSTSSCHYSPPPQKHIANDSKSCNNAKPKSTK